MLHLNVHCSSTVSDINSVADPGCLSRIRLFSIPDPGSELSPSRIPDPNCLPPGSRIRIKEFKYFNPQKTKKWFISSRKYDPGCSYRIPDPDADFLPIPDPGSRGQKGTGSRIRIRNTGYKVKKKTQHSWPLSASAEASSLHIPVVSPDLP
jgi:hypothetical protein